MPNKIKRRLKLLVGKRQFLRRVAQTVQETNQSCSLINKIVPIESETPTNSLYPSNKNLDSFSSVAVYNDFDVIILSFS